MQNYSIAVFGGGCFWCTEAVFQMLKGVHEVKPGYAGGTKPNPTYEEVSSGLTGHAEVIHIAYDPSQVSYRDLLTVFFGSHDPTTKNRQGADIGTQYRSIILTTSDEQEKEAKEFIAELNASSSFGDPIVTEVEPLKEFYDAEDYHQNYYRDNPNQGYCEIVINPKLEKVKAKFAALLNDESKQK
jgi:peptide-methionine (S)-S-oxide reductase